MLELNNEIISEVPHVDALSPYIAYFSYPSNYASINIYKWQTFVNFFLSLNEMKIMVWSLSTVGMETVVR